MVMVMPATRLISDQSILFKWHVNNSVTMAASLNSQSLLPSTMSLVSVVNPVKTQLLPQFCSIITLLDGIKSNASYTALVVIQEILTATTKSLSLKVLKVWNVLKGNKMQFFKISTICNATNHVIQIISSNSFYSTYTFTRTSPLKKVHWRHGRQVDNIKAWTAHLIVDIDSDSHHSRISCTRTSRLIDWSSLCECHGNSHYFPP